NLNQFNSLAPEIKDLYAERLIGVCYNSERSTESCRRKLHESAKENRVMEFYSTYSPKSKSIYDRFFRIPGKKLYSGLKWTKTNPNAVTAPFVDPGHAIYRSFLKDNIEDEWQWNDWKLKVDFGNNSFNPVKV